MAPGWRSRAPDGHHYFARRIPRTSSVLAALVVTLPVTIVLSTTRFAGLGYALLIGAALATLIVVPPRRIRDGVLWGFVATPATSLLVTAALSIGAFSGPSSASMTEFTIWILVMVLVGLTVALAFVLCPLGIVWAALDRRLAAAMTCTGW